MLVSVSVLQACAPRTWTSRAGSLEASRHLKAARLKTATDMVRLHCCALKAMYPWSLQTRPNDRSTPAQDFPNTQWPRAACPTTSRVAGTVTSAP